MCGAGGVRTRRWLLILGWRRTRWTSGVVGSSRIVWTGLPTSRGLGVRRSVTRRSGRGRGGGHAGVHAGERDALVAGEDGRSAAGCPPRRSGGSGRRSSSSRIAPTTFKLSVMTRLFVDKVFDVVGLYLNPPEGAVVLCVDEKSQVQALARSQPAFPMMPGMPEKRTHDYIRHGVTSLFAAFNTADGTVISSLHRRHRTIEFKQVPDQDRHRSPRPPRRAPGLRQLRHPQEPSDQDWLAEPSPLPHAPHPDLLQLAQPGRTLVRLPHRATCSNAATTAASTPSKRHPLLGQSLEHQPQTLHLDQDRRTDPRIPRPTYHTN